MKSILVKWCGKPWLITTYLIGIVIAVVAIFQWNAWEMSRKLLALLAILLPLHVFEENTFPDGFHYMMNLMQKSDRPNHGPMNKLTDMISNFGGEILFLILLLWGGNTGTTILVAFFGIGEAVVHTVFGMLTLRKLKAKGMKTIYGPGLATAYLTLLPLSIYAIYTLYEQTLTTAGIITGMLLIIGVIALCIRVPIMVFGKFQPEYVFENSGYFRKFE